MKRAINISLGSSKRDKKLTVKCGDLIFASSVGRTDLPGGDWEQLVESIKTQVFTLPDDTRLLSGHGPATTVGEEKRNNPFVGGM